MLMRSISSVAEQIDVYKRQVLLCVNGCGTISFEGGNITFYKGDCIFVPADSEVLSIHGQVQFLDVYKRQELNT